MPLLIGLSLVSVDQSNRRVSVMVGEGRYLEQAVGIQQSVHHLLVGAVPQYTSV